MSKTRLLPLLVLLSIAGCRESAAPPEGLDLDEFGDVSDLAVGNALDANIVGTNDVAPIDIAETVRARNAALGGCPTCGEGETFAVSEQVVEHGDYTYTANPSCSNPAAMQQELDQAVRIGAQVAAEDYAGAAEGLLETETFRNFASENVHGTIGSILNRGRTDTANCRAICVIVPDRSTITGFRLEAANEEGGFSGCQAGQDCSIGWSKWMAEPVGGNQSRAMCSTFANWAHTGHRRARMTIFFRPPPDWVPAR